jgi:hypothetical protein
MRCFVDDISLLRAYLREQLDTMMRNSAGFGASGLGTGGGDRGGFRDERPMLGDGDPEVDDDFPDRQHDIVRPADAWPT